MVNKIVNWISECQKGEGCEIINHFVCIVSPMLFYNCSKLAIRLIATLIFNLMFIWLKQKT
jgi:hypothetical protein